jgi:uncharacterized protein YfaS (alpha-2-macroglobulin family)
MKIRRLTAVGMAAGVLLGGWLVMQVAQAIFAADVSPADQRQALEKQIKAGNYKDAYEGYRKLALNPQDDPLQVGTDLQKAIASLRNLGRVAEVDEFRDLVIQAHQGNWRLSKAAAESFLSMENYGFMVAGKFERGNRRGRQGQLMNSAARDRGRALQLLVQALPLVEKDNDHKATADFYLALARVLLNNSGFREAWRLQTLTDVSQLPDYDEGWYQGRSDSAAPVDADGNPVYYSVPKSFAEAANDGQRWRWALSQAVEMEPANLNHTRMELAAFCQSQFGEQTLAAYGNWFNRGDEQNGEKTQSGIYALDTLSEDETIARLATGIKRFKLPDEFNYIKIYQKIADEPKTGHGDTALESLAQIFQNRRQYPKAADYWRRVIKEYGPGTNNQRQLKLDQILKNWGRFEGSVTQPAGLGASLEFRYRNGKQVHFEAHAVKVEKLLDDVKAYIKTKPQQLAWDKLNIGNIGHRLVEQGEKQYLGEKVASWDLPLEPREAHLDRRITITTPLQKAGAYLLTAQMADGNTSKIIIWLSDTVIVKKPLSGRTYLFVADAVTGQPIPHANVEFFGYRQKYIKNNDFQIDTANFADFTDNDGQLQPESKQMDQEYQWIISARTPEGRFAYLGFTNAWRANYYDQDYNQTKVFTITDRPVYRPKQAVKFKFWVRHAKYDQEETSSFADRTFTVLIHNPKNDKVFEKQLKTDAYGGLEGEYELPEDTTLGVYQIFVKDHGGGSFRVEEYKKPEFEVKIEAPKEPLMLGEKITAKIQAKYYFGAPVQKAKVKYKVLRSEYASTWYPRGDWDWFYGPGYWWFSYDSNWYPGWNRWGCKRPLPFWWGGGRQQPEVVADAEVPIGADGTIEVKIDTALAKEIHGNQDHQYQITAEVVDESRRTIVGTGTVLVAREPFKVFAWVDRGHYRVGEVIHASFDAHTLDHQPVQGTGKLKLLKIAYNDKREPQEALVREWDLDTDAQGHAKQQIEASAAGQYRLSYQVTDAKKHTIEGGYLFTIVGEGFNAADFRYNHLELIPDQREYQPGQKVRLMVNTDRVGSTIALFLRPTNGVYLPPKILRLTAKSTLAEIEVTKKDMPNFFVEAVTIADGQLYSELKEIVVPPEKRVLNVAVEPSSENYKPGQAAQVKVTLTDFFGKPFVGSTVVAIYDKSVEYISGGSNVPNIKEFFWKWRRQHYPQNESNLGQHFQNLVKSGQQWMNDLGVFGASAVERLERAKGDGAGLGRGRNMERSAAVEQQNGAMLAGMSGKPQAMDAVAGDDKALRKRAEEPGAVPANVEPSVRTNFADTALWAGSLTTDGDGTALVKLNMPENLTTWKVKVWGLGHGTKVGEGEAEVITNKDLLVRLQAPRFFVQKDEVVLSGNIHNYLKSKKTVTAVLEVNGECLLPIGESGEIGKDGRISLVRTIEIPAGGEQRVDWRVSVANEGEAVVRLKALTDEESDALEMKFPAYIHGMLKTDSVAGAIRPEKDSGQFTVRVPQERRVNQSKLEVRYSPTLAGAMVDALPYMVEYPYGCTEQTLNRFLPTVVTQKVLLELKLDLKSIREKRNNLNAQEIGDPAQRAKGWKRFDRNPVFDEAEVQRMVKQGVQQLTDMQLSDGGWGWFSGYGEHSTPHTTAVVVHGLQIAKQNDVALIPNMLERGIAWLKDYQDKQVQMLQNAPSKKQPYKTQADNIDAFVYMVLVDGGVQNQGMQDFLYRDRTHLAVYAKAVFGLALEKQGRREQLEMILQNISQYLVQDDENQTAYLKLPEDNFWWHWYGSDVEAMGYYLKLLARTDAKGETASRLVKYLLNNRKNATYWNSTRDTAICVEALADFLKASGEQAPDMTVEVWVDGKKQKEVKVNQQNLFTFDNTFVLEGDAVTTGVHTIELKKIGKGPLYYNGYLTNFTLEDYITKAGLELKVQRKYYQLVKVDKKINVAGSRGQAVQEKVEKYERREIPNLSTIKSGQLVEIELEIDSKNDYEYLLFEDMKAAGFEPVDVRSGYAGNSLGAYMELRDNRVCFFVRQLARGKHSVAYRLRAEIPGKFSALPTRASAMYAPELKGNSDEIKVAIED